jgi:hypothetical protein
MEVGLNRDDVMMPTINANHPAVASPEQAVRCPRCGYDQRGVIDTWQNACHLRRACAECGLEIEFAELLSAKIRRPRWCIEFSKSNRFLPCRFLTTLVVSMNPWQFWRELKMSHPPQWPALRLFVTGALALMYVSFCVLNGGRALMAWEQYHRGVPARVRISSGAPPSNQIGTYGCITSVPWWAAVGQAMLMPWSTKSPGALVPDPATMAAFNSLGPGVKITVLRRHPSPSEVLSVWTDAFAHAGQLITFMVIALIVCPLGFAALPASRRKAKVQWRHIGRIAAYSAAMLALTGILVIWTVSPHQMNWYRAIWLNADFPVVLAQFIGPGLLATWWSVATERYLHMNHPWGIGVAVALIGWLAAMLVDVARSGFLY